MSKWLESGQELVTVDDEWLQKKKQNHAVYDHGFVRIMPEGWLYPGMAPFFLDKIQSIKFRSGDIMVMTFPKSGTTWMQEILWTMTHNPDLDSPIAGEDLMHRSLEISQDMVFDNDFLGELKMKAFGQIFNKLCPDGRPEDGMLLQILERMPGRRIIKNHYPLSLMPKDLLNNIKVVYVARSPKDVMASFFHFSRVLRIFDYTGSFQQYVKEFMNSELLFTPYWPHVQQAWHQRHHPNLHFVFYEEMKADIMAELRKLNEFIGTNLSHKQLQNVAEHTSFASMKSRDGRVKEDFYNKDLMEEEGGYMRKGTTGDWRNHFSPELLQEVDQWIEKNVAETGVTFIGT